MKTWLRSGNLWIVLGVIFSALLIPITQSHRWYDPNIAIASETRQVDVIAPSPQQGASGTTLYYTFKVLNRGTLEDRYRLTLTSEKNFSIGQIPPEIRLAPGTGTTLATYVTFPLAQDVVSDRLTLMATSLSDESVSDADTVVTSVAQPKPQGLLTVMADKAVLAPGEKVVYTVHYENTGNVPLTNVAIEGKLPEYMSFEACAIPAQLVDERTRRFALNTVFYQQQQGTFTITAKVNDDAPSKGQLINTLSLVADGLAVPVTAQVISMIEAPHLALKKVVSASEVVVGDILLDAISVSNEGLGAARSVRIVETFPSALQYISGSSILNGTLVQDPQEFEGQQTVWELGDIQPGAQTTLRYQVSIRSQAKSGVYRSTTIAQMRDPNERIFFGDALSMKLLVSDRTGRKVFGQIEGIVFEDVNGNGYHDLDEPGIPGIEVVFVKGLDKQMTDQNGEFAFREISLGEQAVGIDETKIPKGYRLTTEPTVFTSLKQGDTGFVEFGMQSDLAMLTGMVYLDPNQNGKREPQEPGIGKVQLQLDETTVLETDLSGQVICDHLDPGIHRVTLIEGSLPEQYQLRTKSLITVSLDAKASKNISFGVVLKPGTIQGMVFQDPNANGTLDAGEIGQPRMTIELANGRNLRQVVADESGQYSFEDVPPGAYTIRVLPESLPLNYRLTSPLIQTVLVAANQKQTVLWGVASVPEPVLAVSAPTPLPTIKPSPEIPPPTPTIAPAGGKGFCVYTVKKGDTLLKIAASLTGNSKNRKQLLEFNKLSSATLKAGMRVKIPKSLLLASNTSCVFEQVTPTPTPTLTPTPTPMSTLTPTPTPVPPGSIEGRVYYDRNANGMYENDIDLPIPGVTVKVSSGVQTTVTDAAGYYRFDNLMSGGHSVWIDSRTLPEPYAPAIYQPTMKVFVYPGVIAASAVADFIVLKTTVYKEGIACIDLNGNGVCEQREAAVIGLTTYDPPLLTVDVQQIPLQGGDRGGSIIPGENVTFRVTVANHGGSDAIKVKIANSMPEGFTNQGDSAPPIQELIGLTIPADAQPHTWDFTYAAAYEAASGDNVTVLAFEDPSGKIYPELRVIQAFTVAVSETQLPPVKLVVTTTGENPVDIWHVAYVTIEAKNISATPVFDLEFQQIIPPGFVYQADRSEYKINSATDWSGRGQTEPTGPGTQVEPYAWSYQTQTYNPDLQDVFKELKPKETLALRFRVLVDCGFDRGQLKFWVSYRAQGSEERVNTAVSIFNVLANQPIVTVTKTPPNQEIACQAEAAWTILVSNAATGTGGKPVAVPYIWLKDTWGTAYDPATVSLTDASGNPVPVAKKDGNSFYWEIFNLASGATQAYRLTTKSTNCQGTLTNDLTTQVRSLDPTVPQPEDEPDIVNEGCDLLTIPAVSTQATHAKPLLKAVIIPNAIDACSDNVPLRIELTNEGKATTIANLDLDVIFPDGVTYIADTAEVNGIEVEPTVIDGGIRFYTGDQTPPNLPDLQPSEMIVIDLKVDVKCTLSGQFRVIPHFEDCCHEIVNPERIDLTTILRYPRLTLETTNNGGAFECGDNTIDWMVTITNQASTESEPTIPAEMVTVVDTLGEGLRFNGTNADFFEKKPGDTLFSWDVESGKLGWEIKNFAPGHMRMYHLRTGLVQGNCEDLTTRQNRVEATWHCAIGDTADENPGTDESFCAAGAVSQSLIANVSPTVNVNMMLKPEKIGHCGLDTIATMVIDVPAESNTIYNLDAAVALPEGLKFYGMGAFRINVEPAGNVLNLAGAEAKPVDGVTNFALRNANGYFADRIKPGTRITVEFGISASCFDGGMISVRLDYEDCCQNHYTSGNVEKSVEPDYPELKIAIERDQAVPLRGDEVNYAIIVTNTGSTIAKCAQIKAHLSKWLIYQASSKPVIKQGEEGSESSEPRCDQDGAEPCGVCNPGFSEGIIFWEVKDLLPGGEWQTKLSVKFDPPAAGIDCQDDYTKLDISTWSGCPADVVNWTFDSDACTDQANGCLLKVNQELSDSVTNYCGSVGDYVWEDINRNGIQDEGEPGLKGVKLGLFDSARNLIAATTTDANGHYLFAPLAPGEHVVKVTKLTGYNFSPKARGTDNSQDSDVNVATGETDVIKLKPGENSLHEDVGLYQLVSLGNRVWFDANDNGKDDSGEKGIAGVEVSLLDKDGNPVNDSTGKPITATTDADGYYLFDNLVPGQYIVEIPKENFALSKPLAEMIGSRPTEVNPNADVDLNDNGIDNAKPAETGIRSGVVELEVNKEPIGESGPGSGSVPDSNSNLTVDFGFFEPVSLGNRVWFDANDNGVQDQGEPGIAGVELYLLDQDSNPVKDVTGAPIILTTDADGYYLFDNLVPGQYIVEIPKENFDPGKPLAEMISSRKTVVNPNENRDLNDHGLDSKTPTVTGIRSGVIALKADEEPTGEPGTGSGSVDDDNSNLTMDFGFFAPVSLGNRVWFDANDNGVQDPGEPGIAMAEVHLLDKDGNPVKDPAGNPITTTTDINGYYLFDNLVPGEYIVEIPKEDFTTDRPLAEMISSRTTEINPNVDQDLNDNGLDTANPAETGIRSGVVELTPDKEPTGEPESSGSVDDDNSNLTMDFGFFEPVSLGNRVWFDANNNSVQDQNEPGIAGVELHLLNKDGRPVNDPSGNPLMTMTDAEGYYLFDKLVPGEYLVEVSKENFAPGKPLTGLLSSWPTEMNPNTDRDLNDTGIDSVNPAGTGIRSGVIQLIADEELTGEPGHGSGTVDDDNSNLTVDFGFFKPVSLGNRVWFDANDNGLQDKGERGIAGVEVRLLDQNDNPVQDSIGEPKITTTDADGYYLFDRLTPGEYIVEIPQENFATGKPLAEMISSRPTEGDPNADNDLNDNGLDSVNLVETGIRSGVVNVTTNKEPTGEPGPGSGVADDSRSNLTVDFGFFEPVSLGNRVWFDANDNGIQDLSEQGIVGVEVHLLDKDGKPVTDATGNPIITMTDVEGSYLFDKLVPSEYIVEIPQENFAPGKPLAEMISSRPTEMNPNANRDLNDNGLNSPKPIEVGIRSGVVEVTPDSEPTEEPGSSGSVDDNNSNLTVDFGFWQPVSLGNRVWFDANDNGIQDPGERGIAGFKVYLLDKNARPMTDIVGNPITVITDAHGYYRFDNLVPGQYIVEIPKENFMVDQPLAEMISSRKTEIDPNVDVDLNDNGLDRATPTKTGIHSGVVDLMPDQEPTGEPESPGSVDDDNSNLTVDFGFFEPVSLGNRVWFDANDNGIQDPGEHGISGVEVRLLDKDGNPMIDTVGNPMIKVTDGEGYYLFDNLVPGQYMVEIPKENFAQGKPLAEMISSRKTEMNPNADRDLNDNGLDSPNPSGIGIRSGMIDLTPNREPTGEQGSSGSVDDNNSNLTVDFGFFEPVSLGNRVWFDMNNNGSEDPGEPGIAGVDLRLLDKDGKPVIDAASNLITAITDQDGYYLFGNLAPGRYMIEIPKENFAVGKPLAGMMSSTVTEMNPNANEDRNDNGVDDPDTAVYGIRSNVIELKADTEPIGEPGSGSGNVDDDNSNLTVDFGFYNSASQK